MAEGILLLCDLTDRNSFDIDLIRTKTRIDEFKIEIPIVLVGTKSDLHENRQVPREELEELANSWGVPYIETSSKADVNILESVQTVLKYVKPKYGNL